MLRKSLKSMLRHKITQNISIATLLVFHHHNTYYIGYRFLYIPRLYINMEQNNIQPLGIKPQTT